MALRNKIIKTLFNYLHFVCSKFFIFIFVFEENMTIFVTVFSTVSNLILTKNYPLVLTDTKQPNKSYSDFLLILLIFLKF